MIILWFDIAVRRDEVAQKGICPVWRISRVGFRGRQLGSVGNRINVKFSNAPINEASLLVGRKSQVP
jgi:hypothetical protein